MRRTNTILFLITIFIANSIFTGLANSAVNLTDKQEELHVYLCFGQSNMEGNATIESKDKIGVDPRFMVLQAVNCSGLGREQGKWYKAVPPLARCGTGYSLVDNFGRVMVSKLPEHIKVGVINVAIGGCAIQIFDKEGYKSHIEEADGWIKSQANEYGGNPYGRLIELAKIAQGEGAIIKGILLHQGESNNGWLEWPQKVKKIYDDMLQDLGLEENSVPLLAGEMLNKDQNGICWGHNNVIFTLPEIIPNAHIIPSTGCQGKDDRLHFTTSGYNELGKRYARQMLALLNYEQTHSNEDYIDEVFTNESIDEMLPGTTFDLNLQARFEDGHTEAVGGLVSYTSSNSDIAYAKRGKIVAKSGGRAIITATYKDVRGTEKSTSIQVAVKSFFAFDLINPQIWGDGTFDENTNTLTTSQWGAGGWEYNNGIDISGFKYLVAELNEVQTCGASLNIRDENSYWTDAATYNFDSNKRLIIDIRTMKKGDAKLTVDPTHIYMINFWSHGGCPIKIKDIYLTNADDYSKPEQPNAINNIPEDKNAIVDVYTITGIKIYSKICYEKAITLLNPGMYIIGNKKVLIQQN